MADRLVGVDVGGTKVAVAVLAGTALSEPAVHPTEVGDEERLLTQLEEAVRDACPEPTAVGIAVPSVVDFATGTARFSVNIPLAGVALREVLGERLGVPVYVDNDATCAALAEAYDDQRRLTAHHLVMFTVGTGVGGGIVIDGRIYRGATGAAPEIGHTIVAAPLDGGGVDEEVGGERFPRPGSLERLAAGRALDALAKERGFESGKAAVDAAREGDARAVEAVAVIGERLGLGVANAINTFDPDEVVIGGGVSAAGDLLLEPARRVAQRYVLTGVGTRTTIRLARYGNDAGVRGAALLAGQELERDRGRDARTGLEARL